MKKILFMLVAVSLLLMGCAQKTTPKQQGARLIICADGTRVNYLSKCPGEQAVTQQQAPQPTPQVGQQLTPLAQQQTPSPTQPPVESELPPPPE